jgi:hypothetical protein
MRRRRRAALAAAALAVFVAPASQAARAAEPLAGLLDRLGPAKAPEGSVEVLSWVERGGAGSELVVTFVPRGQVKLVADPGVTVTPVRRDGIAWSAAAPVSRSDVGQDYFSEPPILRVPFAGADGKPVEASVEYAYCLVDYQCLFGEAKVSAPTQATPSG